VGGAGVAAVEVVGIGAGGGAGALGDTVVDPTVTEVDVVEAVFGFDPPRQPLRRIPTAPRATMVRLSGINPHPFTTTHAKMGTHAFCE
jgi:hypothetical protein